jgi:hypothetical protein
MKRAPIDLKNGTPTMQGMVPGAFYVEDTAQAVPATQIST